MQRCLLVSRLISGWRGRFPTGAVLGSCLSLSSCADNVDGLFEERGALGGSSSAVGEASGGAPSAGTGGASSSGGAGAANGGAGSGGAGGARLGGNAGGPPVSSADAGVVAPPPECDPCPCSRGPFGAPELVTGLGIEGNVFGPALSADGSTLFFSAIDGDEDIFTATRAGRGTVFAGATRVANVNDDTSEDGTPFLSADGLSLYFFSTRPDAAASGGRDLWVATRPTADSELGASSLVPGVNSDSLDHLPRLSPDELTLMFVSGRDGENAFSNIWISERASRDAAFSVPVELAGINSDVREEGFTLSSDGLTLLFASNRFDEADMDIWVATRLSRVDDFGDIVNLSEINAPTADDIDPALSADGFELFFASERNGPVQLFRSTRVCLNAALP